MKTRSCLLVLAAAWLSSCETPQRGDHSSYYYPSANQPGARSTASVTAASNTPVPRGGYAPGSGPTSMPPTNQFMYQQRETGMFGSRTRSGVIQSTGAIESYQTIGGVPVYPGAPIPGYNPNQPYYGVPSSQPVYVPGVGGNPGYYLNPNTGARMQP